jgi:hypothetical protein
MTELNRATQRDGGAACSEGRAYAQAIARIVDRKLAEDRAAAEIAAQCPRCRPQQLTQPSDLDLHILVSEGWSPETVAFVPLPMNQEQAVAAELLTSAIGRYWRAFGVECLGARLNCLLLILREQAKRMRTNMRILRARADINARARAAWQRGDTDAMQTIEAEPTPRYPGIDRDMDWLHNANVTNDGADTAHTPAGRDR